MSFPLPTPPFSSTTNELLYLSATDTAQARGKKVVRYLTDASQPEANGNYAQGAATFSAGPGPGEIWHLASLQVVARIDTGGPATGPEFYTTAVLPNGYDISYNGPGFAYPLNPAPIRRPSDFLLCGWQLDYLQPAPGRAIWKATADFRALFTGTLALVPGESFSVWLSDDFSPLGAHRFLMTGWIEEK